MGFSFDISGSQIDGARDYQEDAFLITHLSDDDSEDGASLVIVADGMGGHAAGNVASNMAVQTFNKYLTSNYPGEKLNEALRNATLAANQSITETVTETPALRGMGCTLVGALLKDKQLYWVSVGDSHLYLLRNKQLIKKNANHSYGGFLDRMAAAGKPVEPEAGFSRNMLMSALTGDEIAEIDCPETPLDLQAGDRIIISSDGLDSINGAKIASFAESAKNAKEYTAALLKGVTDAAIPRQDNTTVVVIDVNAKEAKGAAAAPAKPAPASQVGLATEKTQPSINIATAAAKPVPRRFEPRPKEPGKTGLIVSVVAALLLLAGGGYFFMTGGKPGPRAVVESPPPAPAAPEAPAAAPEKPAPAAPEAAPAEKPAAVAEGEQPSAKPEAAAAAQKSAAAPAPPAAPIEEFRDKLKSGGEGPEMVWIPAGSFEMGSPDFSVEYSERPRHKVTLQRFAMGKYEITIAQYRRFARATGRQMPDTKGLDPETYPIFSVSWDDAVYYTRWLSQQTGHKYRLPSEAQWEYAAAAGSDTYYWWWGQKAGKGHAHCFGCGSGFDPRLPTKVGSFKPNPFGLYDTAGNVAEWVYDCYHKNYEGAPTDGSIWEGGDCSTRMVRGGSYASPPDSMRSSKRDHFRGDQGNDETGFRVVRTDQ